MVGEIIGYTILGLVAGFWGLIIFGDGFWEGLLATVKIIFAFICVGLVAYALNIMLSNFCGKGC
jgi:hypothetical protein